MNRVTSSNAVPPANPLVLPAADPRHPFGDVPAQTVSQRHVTHSGPSQDHPKSHASAKTAVSESLPRVSDLKKCTLAPMPDLGSFGSSAVVAFCQQLYRELSETCSLLSSLREMLDYAVDLRPLHQHTKDTRMTEFLEVKDSLTISYENGVYTGQSILGKANGIGLCAFHDGSRYSGEWKNNHMHGNGKIIFPSGEYSGEFENGQYSGTGEYAYHHGQRYRGSYKQGQRHGHGVLKLSEESIAGYVGDWIEGKRNGYGIQIFPDGDQYYGEWADDRWHGKGVKIEHSKELIYFGKWEFNQLHGTIHTYKLADTKDYYRGKVITR